MAAWQVRLSEVRQQIVPDSRSSCTEGSVAKVGLCLTDEKRTSVGRAVFLGQWHYSTNPKYFTGSSWYNYQHVNAVVATYPDVKATGPDTFGDAGSIDDSTDDVEEGHEHDPAERGVIERVWEAVSDHKVPGRNHTTQAKSHKHSCSHQRPNSTATTSCKGWLVGLALTALPAKWSYVLP